ncbi:trans-sialidase [Trypanosoma cruzi]|nr:trans-sialidase [Trypanosoma cruzi]
MLLLQLVLAAASLRGHEEKERRGGESAPWLSSSVGMLHGVWRYCSELPHHHARGRDTEWKISFCVCCCGCGCVCTGLVGTMAAEGLAHPTQHRSCRASSITLQHRNRRQWHAARQRKPTPPRVRPEENTSAVAFRGGNPCGTAACPQTSSRCPRTTPGTGRGVFAS